MARACSCGLIGMVIGLLIPIAAGVLLVEFFDPPVKDLRG